MTTSLVRGVSGDPDADRLLRLRLLQGQRDDPPRRPDQEDAFEPRPSCPPRRRSSTRPTAPLSRPLFIYVKKSAYRRAPVAAFVKYYLEERQPNWRPRPCTSRRRPRTSRRTMRRPSKRSRPSPRPADRAILSPHSNRPRFDPLTRALLEDHAAAPPPLWAGLRPGFDRPGGDRHDLFLLGCAAVTVLTTAGIVGILGCRERPFLPGLEDFLRSTS